MLRPTNLLLTLLSLVCLYTSPVHAQARIVSTDAAVTQILFALGLDAELVGVDVTSILPTGYRELPEVGYHRALPAEGLLALNPTLVIGSQHIGPPKVLSTLASVGIPVLQLPSANNIGELKQNIIEIATATGDESRDDAILDQLDRQAAQLLESPLQEERVAFVLSVEPGKLRIAGSGTSGNAFIELLGAQNIADFDAYRTLSAEAILELAPTIILVAGHEGATPERVLEMNPILAHAPAAKAERILPVNAANLVAGLSPDAVTDAVGLTTSLKPTPVR